MILPLEERLELYTYRTPGGCWRWMAQLDRDGYGRVSVNGKSTQAHRAVLMVRGVEIAGLEVDHLCRRRWCVNPMHLDPVSGRVNSLRSESFAARNARRKRCVHGHEFTPENTTFDRGGRTRRCRECARIYSRAKWAARKKAALLEEIA